MFELFSKNKPLPYFVKVLPLPLALFVVLIILTIIITKVGFGQISKQSANIALTRKTINILEQKQILLMQIESTSTNKANILNLALPAKNPALTISSQIKKTVNENLLFMDTLKIGGEVKKQGYSQINVTCEFSGEIQSAFNFIKSIRNIMPLINLDKIKLNQSGSLVKVSMIIKGYWAAYPAQMPAVIDPIKDFTKEENLTLERILTLTQPQMMMNFQPNQNIQRENPFE